MERKVNSMDDIKLGDTLKQVYIKKPHIGHVRFGIVSEIDPPIIIDGEIHQVIGIRNDYSRSIFPEGSRAMFRSGIYTDHWNLPYCIANKAVDFFIIDN